MAEGDLISLEEVARRLGGVSVDTVKRRIREAGIRGPRPGKEVMLTETDYRELVEHLRNRSPLPAGPKRSPQQSLKNSKRRQSKRLLAQVRRGQVVALDLERESKKVH
jgi:excisionase family DNA binding protein